MNPVLNKNTFQTVSYGDDVMTTNGVINKSFILWLILAVGAYIGWKYAAAVIPFYFPILIGALILAMIVIFKKTTCPYLSPFYAFGEGLIMGALTLFFEKKYPGIAFNAIFLTISVLFCMLAAFKAGIIKATNKFYAVVGICTVAIALLYIAELLLSAFGITGFRFIYSSGTVGILFSIFVVIIAALNLILDFDMIQRGVTAGAPKYMEWYGAFALMVTIVWLYLEILRLLSKFRN